MALSIRSAAGMPPGWPAWCGWAAVALNFVMMLLNWITPSRAERLLWGPLTSIIFTLALAVMVFR